LEIGLERLLKADYKKFQKLSIGVLCHPASVDKNLHHISETILDSSLGLQIQYFMGPQHGIRGEKQYNMEETQDFIDPVTNKKVISLYGSTREPSKEVMDEIDALIVDLQDVGTRIYTYIYTLANCMRAAAKYSKKIIVLDRPNPINGTTIEGNVLEESLTSFVGQFPICTRHGMTIGEIARLFNEHFEIGCELEVIQMSGWKRNQYWDELERAWVAPSPQMPSLTAAIVFPGMVHFEGTNISEGRGTTLPFEWIGAPYIDPIALSKVMNSLKLAGVYFRPIYFEPFFDKWKNELCGGVQVHITDRKKFLAFPVGLTLISQISKMYSDSFEWAQPPYEYEKERMPIDLITGTSKFREEGSGTVEALAKNQIPDFEKIRAKYLLY